MISNRIMNAVVYSRDGCQWCDRVKSLFESIDVQYLEYKLDKNFTRDQFYNEFETGATFPQVTIDNQHIGGCKETLRYLQGKNLL